MVDRSEFSDNKFSEHKFSEHKHSKDAVRGTDSPVDNGSSQPEITPTDASQKSLRWRSTLLVLTQLVALGSMMWVTRRLWYSVRDPQAEFDQRFPAVPVWGGWDYPDALQVTLLVLFAISGCALAACVIATFLTTVRPTKMKLRFEGRLDACRRAFALLIVAVGLVLVLENQHRLVPWFFQFLLLVGGYSLLSTANFMRWSRVLIVSIYLYSAICKFDFLFVTTVGRQMLDVMAKWGGIDLTRLPAWSIVALTLSMPIAEMLLGVLLIFRRTRLSGVVLGTVMHLSLVMILGPWGMKNAESVLIWNLFFAVQLWLLFADQTSDEASSKKGFFWPLRAVDSGNFAFPAALVLLIGFPMLEKLNWIDHWPAWSLYSPQTSRCRLWVPESRLTDLPPSIRKYVSTSGDGEVDEWTREYPIWRELDLSRWSIGSINAPVYPQDRFQLGVCLYAIEQFDLDRGFRVELQSAANFWTGERRVRSFYQLSELKRAAAEFRVNALPIVKHNKR